MTKSKNKGAAVKRKAKPSFDIVASTVNYIKSHDKFGVSTPPFNLGGKKSATTLFGGLLSIFIKFISYGFLFQKLNEMVYFSNPNVSEITIQGTPKELSTVYGVDQLGNTSFSI